MWPLLVPVGRGGASGKALAVGAAPRAGGADGVLQPACLPSVDAFMFHSGQFQTFAFNLGVVLIAVGIAIEWVTESKVDELAFVFLWLCLTYRGRSPGSAGAAVAV
jgi:hypothetical protein